MVQFFGQPDRLAVLLWIERYITEVMKQLCEVITATTEALQTTLRDIN